MTGDTAPIRPEESFDHDAVAAYLREHLSDLVGDGPIRFDQFPGGRANLTYRAVAGDVELVLRRAPLGEVAKGAHDMSREYRVLARLWRRFPPAPRAYHYCDDPSVMGKPFFVMERRIGHVIRDRWPSQWPAEDVGIRRRAAEGLVDALAALHAVDPDDVELGDLGYPDGFVARQIEGWAKRWEAARTRHLPEMEQARDLLRRDLPEPQAVSILHNDYKLDNAMVGDGGEIVGIFDWDMATRGDPLIDVGTMLAYWVDPDSATYPIFGENAVPLTPYLSKRDVLDRYAAATGFDASDIAFYEGLALYRITVIIEQIYARYAAGQTSDERFALFEPLAPVLATAAVETLSRA